MPSLSRLAINLLTICAGLVHGLALSDFSPALADVPDPCSSVYLQDIRGCRRSDFSSSAGCSQACLAGLVDINQALNVACQQFSAPSGSLISVFQEGQGIQVLCNVAVVTAPTTQSIPLIGEGTMTLPSTQASTVGSIIVDTSSPPMLTATSATPSPSSTTRTTTSASRTETGLITASGTPTISESSSTSTSTSTSTRSITSTTLSSFITVPTDSVSTTASPTPQSGDDGNSNPGGDPFSPSGAATSLMPSCIFLLLGLFTGLLLLG